MRSMAGAAFVEVLLGIERNLVALPELRAGFENRTLPVRRSFRVTSNVTTASAAVARPETGSDTVGYAVKAPMSR